MALQRSSAALSQCTGKLALQLEDDAPADGARAIFSVDLFNPCWLWPQAPLDGSGGIAVHVGQIPYNFQLAMILRTWSPARRRHRCRASAREARQLQSRPHRQDSARCGEPEFGADDAVRIVAPDHRRAPFCFEFTAAASTRSRSSTACSSSPPSTEDSEQTARNGARVRVIHVRKHVHWHGP